MVGKVSTTSRKRRIRKLIDFGDAVDGVIFLPELESVERFDPFLYYPAACHRFYGATKNREFLAWYYEYMKNPLVFLRDNYTNERGLLLMGGSNADMHGAMQGGAITDGSPFGVMGRNQLPAYGALSAMAHFARVLEKPDDLAMWLKWRTRLKTAIDEELWGSNHYLFVARDPTPLVHDGTLDIYADTWAAIFGLADLDHVSLADTTLKFAFTGFVGALTVVMVAWVLNMQQPASPGSDEAVYLIHQYPVMLPMAAVAVAVLGAALAGACNGLTIVGLRLVPFIVTLGTMGIFRGLAKGIAGEKDIYPQTDTWITGIMDPTLSSIDPARKWMLLPPGVWLLILSAVAAGLLLRYTRCGQHVFAIGSNEETARLCGVPVGRTTILVYTLAGLAGLMQFSFISGIGQPTTAVSYELFIIAAVVIGGGSLMGGEGSIMGSVIGALIITILYMGGQQMGWPKWVQEMVIGAIIVAAVALDRLRHRRMA